MRVEMCGMGEFERDILGGEGTKTAGGGEGREGGRSYMAARRGKRRVGADIRDATGNRVRDGLIGGTLRSGRAKTREENTYSRVE